MSITHLTFVDIETVPEHENLDTCSMDVEFLFGKRFHKEIIGQCDPISMADMDAAAACFSLETKRVYRKNAALHAEFGKIVAISIGKMVVEKQSVETSHEQSPTAIEEPHAKRISTREIDKFYIRSLTGRDEATLLKQASDSFARAAGTMAAHNGLEFDFPYLMRRYMVHGLPMPPQLNVAGVKPWDVKLEDTMKMWSGTQWSHKVSLELLCHVLGIPSPKQDISGADVAQIYWDSFKAVDGVLPFDVEQEAMKKIGGYCNGDVLACAQVYCRMKGLPLIENVEYV